MKAEGMKGLKCSNSNSSENTRCLDDFHKDCMKWRYVERKRVGPYPEVEQPALVG